ncbi:hypothetical protein [Formosa sp. L2A11]|uniref:hypothetical protein n=1 Tax=Formosa sp. L2A11 TaxID=2686363 RepID=UPI00131E3CC0|nr:hypothetical protein [Formosa sp. L2A11]
MYTEPIPIYDYSELEKLIRNSEIHGDIVIRGERITKINGVKKIIGNFGLASSTIIDLGELEEVIGDFWVSSYSNETKITSLCKINKVSGDVRLRYSNIKDIGELQEVGGDITLRDTLVENISNLKSVGGNLFLPKRLEGIIDIDGVTIKGNVRFWNDCKSRVTNKTKKELGLIESDNGVPSWNHQYIYNYDEIESGTQSQKQFYREYKRNFLSDTYLDLKGNDNYSFILLYDLLKEFGVEIDVLIDKYEKITKYYPKTKGYADGILIEKHLELKQFQKAWDIKYNNNHHIGIISIVEFERNIGHSLLDGKLISRLGGTSHLTNFGQGNLKEVYPFVIDELKNYEKEKGKPFFGLFFENGKLYQKKEDKSLLSKFGLGVKIKVTKFSDMYDVDYYKQYFLSEDELYKAFDDQGKNLDYTPEITHVVEKSIFNQFRIILKKAEDLYRESIGMPKIGEGWISETELFYKIKTSFSDLEVIQHASPKWLGRQHLDIYIPGRNIGVEYQGKQHYQAVDFFGGQEALEKTIERDKRKMEKCKVNNCTLIIVDEGYDFEVVKRKIKRAITEYNKVLW